MNGLCEITIAGQKVGLKFGMPALRRIVEKMREFKLVDGNKSNELGVVHILFAGYENYCAMHDKPTQFAFPAFYDYVEVAGDNDETRIELMAALDEFENSRFVQAAIEEKKRATMNPSGTGTISTPSASENSGLPPASTPASPGGSTSLPQKGTPKKDRTSSSTRGRSSTPSPKSTATRKSRSRR